MADADKKIVKVLKVGVGYNIVQYEDNTTARRTGTFAARNNNPGNIENGGFARANGSLDLTGVEVDLNGYEPGKNRPDRFAIFPTYEMGRATKTKLLFEGINYKDKSIAAAIERYAPPSENQTENYIRTVVTAVQVVKPSVTRDTVMKTLTPQERIAFIDAIERVESGAGKRQVTSSSEGYGPGQGGAYTAGGTSLDTYMLNTYVTPLKTAFSNDTDVKALADDLQKGKSFVSFDKKEFRTWLQQTNKLTDASQLNGELALLNLAAEVNLTLQAEAKSNLTKINNLIPAEAAWLIQNNLFELQPDLMRQQMSANAGDGNREVDYSHAWRAPGKLAITADITIPGASGFRIGQIFWVGRTYEHYKKYGAFQLFGLTESITIGRGWNTTIHSRFNAMPTGKVKVLQQLGSD